MHAEACLLCRSPGPLQVGVLLLQPMHLLSKRLVGTRVQACSSDWAFATFATHTQNYRVCKLPDAEMVDNGSSMYYREGPHVLSQKLQRRGIILCKQATIDVSACSIALP